LGPIPNPQSPIPNPQSPIPIKSINLIKENKYIIFKKFIKIRSQKIFQIKRFYINANLNLFIYYELVYKMVIK